MESTGIDKKTLKFEISVNSMSIPKRLFVFHEFRLQFLMEREKRVMANIKGPQAVVLETISRTILSTIIESPDIQWPSKLFTHLCHPTFSHLLLENDQERKSPISVIL